jgi:putative membrane protein
MASMQADQDWYRHRRFIGWGIAGLLLLIGVALVIGVVARVIVGPGAGFGFFPFFFFPFGFFLFIFFLFFLFRGLFWGWGGWGWRGYPMYGRYGYGYHDGAAEILRRRYASGEITKDQFDQMMRDLAQSRTPPP